MKEILIIKSTFFNVFLSVLLVFALDGTGLAQNKNNKAEKFYEQGYDAYDAQNYNEAIGYCSRAILQNSKFSDAYWLRASAYFNNGQVNEAINDYYTAIYFFRDSTKDSLKELSILRMNRGYAYSTINKTTDALSDYNIAISLNPENGQALWDRAIIYQNLGYFENAIEDYSFASKYYLQDKISSGTIYADRAQCFENLNKMDQAMADCNTSLILFPDNGIALWVRALIYENRNQNEKAIDDLSKATKYYKDDEGELAKLYWEMGNNYKIIMDYKEASRKYGEAIDHNANYAEAYYWRAILEMNELNEKNRAKNDFMKVIETDANPDFIVAVSQYYTGDKISAVQTLNLLLENSYADAYATRIAYYEAASLYSIMNDEAKAIRYLDKALIDGYDDYQQLKTDENLNNIRQTDAFKQLLIEKGVK